MPDVPEDQKDRIRKAYLGTDFARRFELVEWNGEKLEVRRITIGRQKYIEKQSMRTTVAADAKGQRIVSESQDSYLFTILSVIYCCYVPGTNELVFDEKDRDELLGMAADGFMEKILDAISKVNKPPEDMAIGKEPAGAKNSARTPAGTSST